MNVNILIIEDEVIVANSIKLMLGKNNFNRIYLAQNHDEVKAVLRTEKIGLILSDINLEHKTCGLSIVREILKKHSIPVIFLTAYSDEQTIKELQTIEHCAYITKPFNEKQLMAAINATLIKSNSLAETQPTDREMSVLKLIAKGHTSKEIAKTLDITFNTVESHRKNMMKKHGVKTTAELVCMATSKGWISYM